MQIDFCHDDKNRIFVVLLERFFQGNLCLANPLLLFDFFPTLGRPKPAVVVHFFSSYSGGQIGSQVWGSRWIMTWMPLTVTNPASIATTNTSRSERSFDFISFPLRLG
jgi:hypothetical protein